MIVVVVLPHLGILVCLILRGRAMAERAAKPAQAAQQQYKARVRATAGTSAVPAEQIAQAKAVLGSGAITQVEFETIKAAALAS